MKRKELFYWVVLASFALIALISLSYILISQNFFGKLVLGKKTQGNGAFYIEADREVLVSTMFKAQIIADSDNQAANAVALFVSFDPDKLSIVNVDTSKSFCQFYPVNKFNDTKGTISIECGSPSPGFKGQNTIAEITFMAKTVGETKIKISENSLILLNDGKGTNIFSQPSEQTVMIVNHI
ncbi:MAG: cohesin domain-containing protein [Patescibacteria group bacterium]|jgi:hypothetical protein